eukprot:TRINITY_DN14630_c0_g1_i2.p1 TRINITY_DN14630_c0_g1~~TRINITY_DN14630_c0_g1_i2.p1  ORF type:complete len:279 (-),score=46.20 TRINITY_DN14630_c0_g1_i2:1-837(-)
MARQIIQGKADVNATGQGKWTALHMAVSADQGEMVELLLGAGAELSCKANNGYTALHMSVQQKVTHITRALLTARADPTPTNNAGRTPLHDAVETDSSEIVQLLIAHKADLTVKATAGYTALHSAAGCNSLAAAKMLLEAGASIDGKCEGSEYTPLHSAVHDNNGPEVARLLLEAQANPNLQSQEGKTVLGLALEQAGGNSATIQLLKAFGAVSVSYTHLRAHETVLDLVCRLLLEKKKNHTKPYPIHLHKIILYKSKHNNHNSYIIYLYFTSSLLSI